MATFKNNLISFLLCVGLSGCQSDIAPDFSGKWIVLSGLNMQGAAITISFGEDTNPDDDRILMTATSETGDEKTIPVFLREDGIYVSTFFSVERLMYRNDAGEMRYGPLTLGR